jgi:hypothetical protein
MIIFIEYILIRMVLITEKYNFIISAHRIKNSHAKKKWIEQTSLLGKIRVF